MTKDKFNRAGKGNTAKDESDATAMGLMCEAGMSVLELEKDLSFRSKDMNCHLTIIKWIGVVMLATTCAVPGFVLLSGQVCLPLKTQDTLDPELNQTACIYAKQFYLRDNLYATVCNQRGYVITDIRKFINDSATIIGVSLNEQQWAALKHLSGSIDTAISEARSYWNNLKSYKQP